MLAAAAAACIYYSAHASNLPPPILMAILHVEGGWEGAHIRNTNGTEDFGPGQINTIWLKEVARASGQTPEQAQKMLQNNGCFNIRTTAAILRLQIDQAHDFWLGVGWYHSRSKEECLKYIRKVVVAARQLFGPNVIAKADIPLDAPLADLPGSIHGQVAAKTPPASPKPPKAALTADTGPNPLNTARRQVTAPN